MSHSASVETTPSAGGGETGLRKGRLGTIGIVFFVVAAAAPLVGMTGAVPVAIVLGNGAAAPGAYLAVGLTLLVFSVGYAAMSSAVTNTGAFFAYVGRGLGLAPGVGSAFVSMVAYLAVQLAVFGFFGAVMAGQMQARLGIDLAWWAWSLIAWALVLALSVLSVDVGAKVLGVLMVLEIGSLLVVAIAALAQADELDFGASFSPGNIFAGGFAGSAGIALAFAFASFIGFEATAIYGEESKDPKRTVPRATYLAVGTITVLFAITSFGLVSGLGADEAVPRTLELSSELADPAAVLFGVADQYVGTWLGTLMSWLVLSSLFAGLLAFQNSAARYFFAMGRAGVLPGVLGRTNRSGAPHVASVLTSVISLVVILVFALADLDPVLNLFNWFSGLAVVAILLVEALVSVAVIVYFRRAGTDKRIWHTLIAPALATIGIVLGLYLLISRFGLLAGTVSEGADPTTQAFALSTTGWVLVVLPFVAFVVGTLIGAARRTRENADAVRDLVS
ncbi:APC family permease [Blastococcus sp. SYSU D00820]